MRWLRDQVASIFSPSDPNFIYHSSSVAKSAIRFDLGAKRPVFPVSGKDAVIPPPGEVLSRDPVVLGEYWWPRDIEEELYSPLKSFVFDPPAQEHLQPLVASSSGSNAVVNTATTANQPTLPNEPALLARILPRGAIGPGDNFRSLLSRSVSSRKSRRQSPRHRHCWGKAPASPPNLSQKEGRPPQVPLGNQSRGTQEPLTRLPILDRIDHGQPVNSATPGHRNKGKRVPSDPYLLLSTTRSIVVTVVLWNPLCEAGSVTEVTLLPQALAIPLTSCISTTVIVTTRAQLLLFPRNLLSLFSWFLLIDSRTEKPVPCPSSYKAWVENTHKIPRRHFHSITPVPTNQPAYPPQCRKIYLSITSESINDYFDYIKYLCKWQEECDWRNIMAFDGVLRRKFSEYTLITFGDYKAPELRRFKARSLNKPLTLVGYPSQPSLSKQPKQASVSSQPRDSKSQSKAKP
ncbi:uncharacterized protein MELLADRAFT_105510 [Melampsora larici-populina 98AG31]|uniref:Uncharacterized protein n=1 Tax=Melampsora larici-populina (strain 98AG31 / pathotype 3-4-7) TaxID=747676 RepID=F4RIG2_MELLP|nr:uncharacterized protein MELLADRAFT_105510 [Melampsora larici-populina 98AG31]EGG07558.1 hypothetical protein MELLADRAFT_105510 [Melampsora larici-populina 98AG31]